jgi:malate dehydrogenase
MCSKLIDRLTVCDIKPGLAAALAEELRHVTASIGFDVVIESCEQDENVRDADIILISAGNPRIPGIKMTRRDLAIQNGKIIKEISQATINNNPQAKYIVISNPVDAMAMVCKKYTKADFVISTGTNLESLRFRSKLAKTLGAAVSSIEGWVGGEHGDAATALWSTVKVAGLPLETYLASRQKSFSKDEVEVYIKNVSKSIVDNIGATEFGPAASFRDITRAIINNTNEIFPVSSPRVFDELSEPVFVSVPLHLGSSVNDSLYQDLPKNEQEALSLAAQEIYKTYKTAIENID